MAPSPPFFFKSEKMRGDSGHGEEQVEPSSLVPVLRRGPSICYSFSRTRSFNCRSLFFLSFMMWWVVVAACFYFLFLFIPRCLEEVTVFEFGVRARGAVFSRRERCEQMWHPQVWKVGDVEDDAAWGGGRT